LKVYVVTEEYGQYSDYTQGIIGVYSSPSTAWESVWKAYSNFLRERSYNSQYDGVYLTKWTKQKDESYSCYMKGFQGETIGNLYGRSYRAIPMYIDDIEDDTGLIIERKPRKAEDLLIRDFNFGE